MRLAAPLLPLMSEVVWTGLTGEESVHLVDWPTADELRSASQVDGTSVDPAIAEVAAEALAELRKHKTNAKRSLVTPMLACTITDTPDRLALLQHALADVAAAARATHIDLVEGVSLSAEVELEAPPE